MNGFIFSPEQDEIQQTLVRLVRIITIYEDHKSNLDRTALLLKEQDRDISSETHVLPGRVSVSSVTNVQRVSRIQDAFLERKLSQFKMDKARESMIKDTLSVSISKKSDGGSDDLDNFMDPLYAHMISKFGRESIELPQTPDSPPLS